MRSFEPYQRYILIGVFILLVALSLWIIRPFLIAVFTGLLLVYMFYPLYRWVESKVQSPSISALIVSVIIVGIIVVLSTVVVNTISQEVFVLFFEFKKIFLNGGVLLQNCSVSVCNQIESVVADPQVQDYVQRGTTALIQMVVDWGRNLIFSLPKIVANLAIVFFVAFYGLRDSKSLVHHIRNLLCCVTKKHEFVFARFQSMLYAVLFGTLFVALVQGAIGGVGFWLFGVPSPLSWTIVMMVFALIPFVGPAVIWFPIALLQIANGFIQNSNSLIWRGVGLLLYGFLVISTIDNILKPKIIGDQSGIHPVLILVGLVGGLTAVGPVGIVFGPLVLAMAVTMFEVYFEEGKVS